MSQSFSMVVDPVQLENITKRLDGIAYKSPTVLKTAANDTGKKAVKLIEQGIKDEYTYQGKASLKDYLKRKSASYANPRSTITVKSSMNEIIDFDVSNRTPLAWTDPASWVAGHVRSDTSRTPLMQTGHKAFVINVNNKSGSSHLTVVARTTGRHVSTIYAPSFTHMVKRTYEEVEDVVSKTLQINVDKQIEKVMSVING